MKFLGTLSGLFQLYTPDSSRPFMVRKEIENTPNFRWSEVSGGPFSAKQLKLTLLNFLDWDVQNWRDSRYFRVRIHAFEDRPQFIGCDTLVDVLEADVLWNVSDEATVGLDLGVSEPGPSVSGS